MPNDYSRFYALVKELNMPEDVWRGLISQFSHKNSNSIRELLRNERWALEKHLQSLVNAQKNKQRKAAEKQAESEPISTDQQRKKLFSLLFELKWTTPEGRIDWPRFNRFTRSAKCSVASKMIDSYTQKELSKLIGIFEGMEHNNTLQQGRNAVKELKQELGFTSAESSTSNNPVNPDSDKKKL